MIFNIVSVINDVRVFVIKCIRDVKNFAPFLADNFSWLKKASTSPREDSCLMEKTSQPLVDIVLIRRTCTWSSCTVTQQMFGLSFHVIPFSNWQVTRAHYGFQSTGAHLALSLMAMNAQKIYSSCKCPSPKIMSLLPIPAALSIMVMRLQ